VNPAGLPQGKGYRRIDFEEPWERYCPGQIGNPSMTRPWTDQKMASCPKPL